MALSLRDLPRDEFLDIVTGPPVKKLDLAFFGEDEEDVPLAPILRFTVRYKGQRCEVHVLAKALEIAGEPGNKREYNIVGALLARNAGKQWFAVGKAEVFCYSPKGGQRKGTLRLNMGLFIPPLIRATF